MACPIVSGRSNRVIFNCGKSLAKGNENAPTPEPTSNTVEKSDQGKSREDHRSLGPKDRIEAVKHRQRTHHLSQTNHGTSKGLSKSKHFCSCLNASFTPLFSQATSQHQTCVQNSNRLHAYMCFQPVKKCTIYPFPFNNLHEGGIFRIIRRGIFWIR